VQRGVQAAPDDQLFVCALILDHALIQNNNAVYPFERGDTVRDEEDGLLREIACQARKNPAFGRTIQGTRGFIKQ